MCTIACASPVCALSLTCLTVPFPRTRSVDYYPPVRRAMMEGAGIAHSTAIKAEDFSISYHKTYKVAPT